MPKSESFEITDRLLMRNLSSFNIFEILSTPETMMTQSKTEFSKRKSIHFFKITHLFNYNRSSLFYRFVRDFHIFLYKEHQKLKQQCSDGEVLYIKVFLYTTILAKIYETNVSVSVK